MKIAGLLFVTLLPLTATAEDHRYHRHRDYNPSENTVIDSYLETNGRILRQRNLELENEYLENQVRKQRDQQVADKVIIEMFVAEMQAKEKLKQESMRRAAEMSREIQRRNGEAQKTKD